MISKVVLKADHLEAWRQRKPLLLKAAACQHTPRYAHIQLLSLQLLLALRQCDDTSAHLKADALITW